MRGGIATYRNGLANKKLSTKCHHTKLKNWSVLCKVLRSALIQHVQFVAVSVKKVIFPICLLKDLLQAYLASSQESLLVDFHLYMGSLVSICLPLSCVYLYFYVLTSIFMCLLLSLCVYFYLYICLLLSLYVFTSIFRCLLLSLYVFTSISICAP